MPSHQRGAISDEQLGELRAGAHLPEVQERIRREIVNGTIRIVAIPGGGISIVRNEAPGESPLPCQVATKGGRGRFLRREAPETGATWYPRIEPRS
jgi:hypothetical protein